MASKRSSSDTDRSAIRDSEDDTEGSSACKNKKKSYCHYKSSWKTKIFSVEIAGNTKKFSREVLLGKYGNDSARCSF